MTRLKDPTLWVTIETKWPGWLQLLHPPNATKKFLTAPSWSPKMMAARCHASSHFVYVMALTDFVRFGWLVAKHWHFGHLAFGRSDSDVLDQ